MIPNIPSETARSMIPPPGCLRVYKYGTGEPIPTDAVYLTTLVEEYTVTTELENGRSLDEPRHERLVWHYFLIWDRSAT